MKNIKLYIGELNSSQSKKSWINTIDSVLATQSFVKSKFLYRTVIIFRKSTMQDVSYPMTNSLYYSSSEFDSLIVHNGTSGSILINELAYYFDGAYYYYYLVLYSNTFGLWNVVNNNSIYAVLYDQSSVTIQGGVNYIMDEFRITKNVSTLNVSGNVSNVTKLVLPNSTLAITEFASYSQFSDLEKFELFDMGVTQSTQEVQVYKGLLYTTEFSELIAIPIKYKGESSLFRSSKTTSTTTTTRINLHTNCTCIRNLAFNDDSYGNIYLGEIDEIVGDNVRDIQSTGLAFTKIKSVMFPKLIKISDAAFASSLLERLYLPNTVADVSPNFVDGCEQLTTVILGYNFNCNLTLSGANNINGISFGQQLYNLKVLDKDYPKTIEVMSEVFNSIPQADKDYATSINWNIVEL